MCGCGHDMCVCAASACVCERARDCACVCWYLEELPLIILKVYVFVLVVTRKCEHCLIFVFKSQYSLYFCPVVCHREAHCQFEHE